MRLTLFSFFITVITLQFNTAQAQAPQDSSVDVLPHWKKGEGHTVQVKSATNIFNNGKTQNTVSTFDGKFTVLEKNDTAYIIEWVYTGIKLAENDPVLENQVAARLVNTKIVFRLTEVGRFAELINVDEVRAAANKAIDGLIAGSVDNQAMSVQFKTVKQLISTKQGLEITLLKQIKFYNFSFGFNYKLHYVQTNNLKYPNPLGGPPFDAVEKVQLTKLDTRNTVCVIETSKTIDGTILKKSVVDYVTKVSKAGAAEVEAELGNNKLEISESTMQQIDFAKGTLQKSFYRKTMNLGFQSMVTTLEIETVE